MNRYFMKVLESLRSGGIDTFVYCDENFAYSEFFSCINEDKSCTITRIFNIRSAGFYALGLSQRKKSAVAIMVANETELSCLLSPVTEACYQDVPLVLIYIGGGFEPSSFEFLKPVVPQFFEMPSEIKAEDSLFVQLTDELKRCYRKPFLIKMPEMNYCIEEFKNVFTSDIIRFLKTVKDNLYIMIASPALFTKQELEEIEVENMCDLYFDKYGAVSMFIGHSMAAKRNCCLIIEMQDLLADLNALWVRGASNKNVRILVINKEKSQTCGRLDAWMQRLGYQYIKVDSIGEGEKIFEKYEGPLIAELNV